MKKQFRFKKPSTVKKSNPKSNMLFKLINKNKSELPFNNFAEYYIGPDVEVNGECKTDQDIYIDGKFKGSIDTSGLIELAKNSKINADIKARTAIIEGNYSGNAIVSDELHLTSCSTANGNLNAPNLIIDKGAIVNAKIKMERN